MTNFYIKNFSLYPSVIFTEELNIEQEINFLGDEVINVSDTSNLERSVNDAMARVRKIQSVLGSFYKLEMLVARNINLSLLKSADSVLIETLNGDYFNIFDVKTEFEDMPNSSLQKVSMTFYRVIENNVLHHLSSENVEANKYVGIIVNELNFKVLKPAITQNTNVYLHDWTGSNTSTFKFKKNELTENININDWFYCHIQNANFDSDFSAVSCINIDSNFIYFVFVDMPNFVLDSSEITIDFEPESFEGTLVEANHLELDISIFTYLYSKFNNSLEFTGENKQRSGFVQEGNVTSTDFETILFYVTDSELWKIKYLAYATEIILKQKDKADIIPIYTKNLIKRNDRPDLIGLHEIEIKLPYNLQNVNLLR